MARIHVGLTVSDIDASVTFYSQLFGVEPALVRDDYAKWMLDDPLLNFSVNTHGDEPVGSAHFGIQVNDEQCLKLNVRDLSGSGFLFSIRTILYAATNATQVLGASARWCYVGKFFFTEVLLDEYGTDEVPCGEKEMLHL